MTSNPPNKQLKFIHITKTAGSSIESVGLENNHRWGINHVEYGFWHEIFTRKPEALRKKYDWFMVVRNPYTKAISAYLFFKAHYNIVIDDNATFPSFTDFLNIIKNGVSDKFYKNHKFLYYFHYYHFLITQYDHIIDNSNNININYIGKFENLNKELIEVLNNLKLKLKLEHIDQIKNNSKINSTLKFKNFDYYFDQESLYFINNHFEKDFIFFGYERYYTINELASNINLLNEENIFKKNNTQLLEKLTINYY
jgi:hypothetical protein